MSVYANFADFSTPGTYNINAPSGTNQIKVYLVSGGGGGGGGGGGQSNNRPKANNNIGGGGGSGSSGEIGFFIKDNFTSGDIKIVVGSGGAGGNGGNKGSSGRNTSMSNASGKSGNNGIDANLSSVTIGNDTYFEVPGGKGGKGGGGAVYSRGGNDGTPGTGGVLGGIDGKDGVRTIGGQAVNPITTNSVFINPGNLNPISNSGLYPTTNPGESGKGGDGGSPNTAGTPGAKGKNGFVRIYFL